MFAFARRKTLARSLHHTLHMSTTTEPTFETITTDTLDTVTGGCHPHAARRVARLERRAARLDRRADRIRDRFGL
jgi:hypothetical protein